MTINFTDTLATPVADNATSIWPVHCDRDQLLITLRRAAEQASRQGHQILASFTFPVPQCDPLRFFIAFKSLNMGDRFFWGRPADRRILVGVGAVTTIETTGPAHVTNAIAAWRALHRDCVATQALGKTPAHTSGPILFGGFSFDPLSQRTPLWEGYPDGLLILPRLLFHWNGYCAALTINQMIQPSTSIESYATKITSTVQRLCTLVEDTAQSESEEEGAPPQHFTEHNLLSPAEWMARVDSVVGQIRRGAFSKVVLARAVAMTNDKSSFDVATTLYRLRESYPGAYVFAIQRGTRYFVGATPERLVCGTDGQVQTVALAGSAPRGATEEEDLRLGAELLQSAKNQEEHQYVVATIREALSSLCTSVQVANPPHLRQLQNIQHLETTITGDLQAGRSILETIEDLHPTPAVGGVPRQSALEAIRSQEGMDRGWYAAPIGWVGASGNGEFAVALRSALIDGNQATLFAGCGIVADSKPESEYAESCWKLQVMQRALCGND